MIRLNRFYGQMIFLWFNIFFLSCQNPSNLMKNDTEQHQIHLPTYLNHQGLFWIRQEVCDCLNEDRSLDYEILFLAEISDNLQNLDVAKELQSIIEKKEKIDQKPWYQWGRWERIHLHEQIMGDVEKMQKLTSMLQSKPMGVLVLGEISSDLYEQSKHAFRTLQIFQWVE